MIKIFRKVRLRLLSENKISNYLLYAIGEIILVVIGILIALQINNWNDGRQLKKEEFKYYKNIKQQLLEDVEVIQNNKEFNQRYFDQYQYALQQITTNNRSNIDSLSVIAFNLMEYSDFHKEGNIYQSLVNSGEIKLLNNQSIIDVLQRLDETYIYINRIEDSHFDIIKSIYPELNKLIRFKTLQIENIDKIFEFEFENYFVLMLEIMKEKNEVYNQALNQISYVVKLIDEELLTNRN